MANINDYLIWRGDISISDEFPLNEVDNMILARISYLRFDLINIKDNETLFDCAERMKNVEEKDFLYTGDSELIRNLGESKRFSSIRLTDYVNENEKESEKQFAAVTIHILPDTLFISYMGTDSTINGWKEDFNMAFMDSVPCQIAGKEYLEMIANKYPDKKLMLAGHSKGGCVAIYAAVTVNDYIKKRIVSVTNYDGPGFSNSMIEKYYDADIISRTNTIIPQDSVIGRVLEHKERTSVCLSIEKGIYQHDIYSWQIVRDKPVKLERNTNKSEIITDTLSVWLEKTTSEQRKLFVDIVFELIYNTDAEHFSQISKSPASSIPKIIKKYNEIESGDRRIIFEMVKVFIKSYIEVFREKDLRIEPKNV